MRKALGNMLIFLLRLFLPLYFKMSGKLRKDKFDLDGVSAPFFVVANHQATLDPFFIGVNLRGPMSFVATDMLFRVPIMNFLMRAIGSISKSKFTIDSSAVREMMHKVRNGCSVAIFPEGQRCIAGYTEPLVPGIGKLAKLLDVPVVAVHLKGGFMADPFWALKKRRGPIYISAEVLLTRDRLRSMDPCEVEEVITSSLQHSDYEWINSMPELRYRGRDKALGLHNAMFICPECAANDCFITEGDNATCKSCGYSIRWGERGEFSLIKGSKLYHKELEAHDRWQRAVIRSLASEASSDPAAKSMFGPCSAIIRRSRKSKPLVTLGVGRISLFSNSIRMETDADCAKEFPLAGIQGFSIFAVWGKHNRMFEFLDKDGFLYNITLHDPLESTYKWLLMVSYLKSAIRARADS